MIYLFDGIKFKEQKYKTSGELISGFNKTDKYTTHKDDVDTVGGWKGFSIDEVEKFDNMVKRYKDIYCWIQPFVYGYSNGDIIYWSDNPEESKNDFYQWQENV